MLHVCFKVLIFVGAFNSSSVESSPRETPGRSKIHRRNERGETLLHLACIRGDTAGVLSLVDQGADTNVTDNAGICVLSLCVCVSVYLSVCMSISVSVCQCLSSTSSLCHCVITVF